MPTITTTPHLYHVRITLAGATSDQDTMLQVANGYFLSRPDIAERLVVEVRDRGGWWVKFLNDGSVVGTPVKSHFYGKSAQFRQWSRQATWTILPPVTR